MLNTIFAIVTMLAAEGGSNLAAGIAVFTGAAAAIGMGLAVSKAVEAMARQPEASSKIYGAMLFGLIFMETIAIYGTLVAILLMVL